MGVYVALLRAINVGGRNRVPMAELRSSLARLGLDDVRTYVQSGNVVFRSRGGTTRDLAHRIEREISKVFGIEVSVILRTPAQLEDVVASNPFLEDEADETKLHVVFLDKKPARSAVAGLDENRSPPDAFTVGGREMYLRLPKGAGRSKLTIDYFERRLAIPATARNWKTVTTLLAMAAEVT